MRFSLPLHAEHRAPSSLPKPTTQLQLKSAATLTTNIRIAFALRLAEVDSKLLVHMFEEGLKGDTLLDFAHERKPSGMLSLTLLDKDSVCHASRLIQMGCAALQKRLSMKAVQCEWVGEGQAMVH